MAYRRVRVLVAVDPIVRAALRVLALGGLVLATGWQLARVYGRLLGF